MRLPCGRRRVRRRVARLRRPAPARWSWVRAFRPPGAALLGRVRSLLDLDTDGAAVPTHLPRTRRWRRRSRRHPGPGARALDGWELLLRTMVGQQISLAAARTHLARLVAALGEPVEGMDGWRLVPSAGVVAERGREVLAGPRARVEAVLAAAAVVADGVSGPVAGSRSRPRCASDLLALRGRGPVDRVVCRRCGSRTDTDVLLTTDLVVRQGADVLGADLDRAERWSPLPLVRHDASLASGARGATWAYRAVRQRFGVGGSGRRARDPTGSAAARRVLPTGAGAWGRGRTAEGSGGTVPRGRAGAALWAGIGLAALVALLYLVARVRRRPSGADRRIRRGRRRRRTLARRGGVTARTGAGGVGTRRIVVIAGHHRAHVHAEARPRRGCHWTSPARSTASPGSRLNPVRVWQHLTGTAERRVLTTVDEERLTAALTARATESEVAPKDGAVSFADGTATGVAAVTGVTVPVDPLVRQVATAYPRVDRPDRRGHDDAARASRSRRSTRR